MLFEAGFRELVDSYAGILAMSREARLARMERIAGEIIDDALTRRDPGGRHVRVAPAADRRDPIATGTRVLAKLLERKRPRAGKLNAKIEAGRLCRHPGRQPAQPAPADPMAQALAAEAMRPRQAPRSDGRALLAQGRGAQAKMLDEQVLHHAVEASGQRELGMPAEPHAVQHWPTCARRPRAVLTRDELQTLAEIGAMYRVLPEDRLRQISCATRQKGWKKIFAVLAFENGLGGWPSGP